MRFPLYGYEESHYSERLSLDVQLFRSAILSPLHQYG
jgi:hypothetical protein